MEFKQLEMFIAVVEAGSVQKAAERVFRTPPAVSIALKKLEEELDVVLFDRSERYDFALTEAGEVLYEHAARMIQLRDGARTALSELRSLGRGRLRVGANESTSVYLLPAIARAFHERHPAVTLEIVCQHSDRLLVDLKARKLDLALLAYSPEDDELATRAIMRDRVVMVASPQHRLAKASRPHVRDLAGEPILIEGVESSVRERVVAAFARFGTPLNVWIEASTIETIKKMAAMNAGLGFVPEMCVREELAAGGLVAVPLDGFDEQRVLRVAWRRYGVRSKAADRFLDVVLQGTGVLGLGDVDLDASDADVYAVCAALADEARRKRTA